VDGVDLVHDHDHEIDIGDDAHHQEVVAAGNGTMNGGVIGIEIGIVIETVTAKERGIKTETKTGIGIVSVMSDDIDHRVDHEIVVVEKIDPEMKSQKVQPAKIIAVTNDETQHQPQNRPLIAGIQMIIKI
jgi:hypothetical protein